MDGVIIDKNARIGDDVRLVNEHGLEYADGEGFYIRGGIIVVPEEAESSRPGTVRSDGQNEPVPPRDAVTLARSALSVSSDSFEQFARGTSPRGSCLVDRVALIEVQAEAGEILQPQVAIAC